MAIVYGEVIDKNGIKRMGTESTPIAEFWWECLYQKIDSADLEEWSGYPYQFIPRRIE